jgi:hypothetical protein
VATLTATTFPRLWRQRLLHKAMARTLLPSAQVYQLGYPIVPFRNVGAPEEGRGQGMKHRTLFTLYTYWNQVRAGRLAPRRLEIEPSRIAGILAETFMLERMNPSTYPYRLAGTRLCELLGRELRGTNFLTGWTDEDQRTLERLLASVCEQGAVVTLTADSGPDEHHRVETETILLPLLHAGSTVGRIIGATSATSTPHWLQSRGALTHRLVRHEVVWPDGRPHSIIERSGQQAPFQAEPTNTRIAKTLRGQFRVLDGGRSNANRDRR